MFGKWLHMVLAAAAMSMAGAASAEVIVDDANDDFTIEWSQAVSSGAYSGTLSATALFDVQSISAGQAVFKVTVSNTTTGNFVNAGLAAFSFLTNPDSTGSYQTAGAVFDGISSGAVPSFKYHTVCAYTANNCSGGAQGGLLAIGESDTFWLKLTWSGGAELQFPDDRSGKQGTYDNWAIKFQTNVGSYEFAACTGPCLEQFDVPSPAPLALLGLGLMSMAAARRRRS